MTDDRKNIKVSEETFERLRDEKPEGVTWDFYLRRLADDETVLLESASVGPDKTFRVDGHTVTLAPGERRLLNPDTGEEETPEPAPNQ